MSQNKTVIQGLEPADNNGYNGGGGANSSFYSRGGANRPVQRGTYVPGMSDRQPASVQRNPNATVVDQGPQAQPQRNATPFTIFYPRTHRCTCEKALKCRLLFSVRFCLKPKSVFRLNWVKKPLKSLAI